MKKYIIIIFLIILCANCKQNHTNTSASTEKNIEIQEQIFISETIQDTLNLFITTFDSVPNPYGAPTNYLIFCEKVRNDTFIKFIAFPGLFKTVDIDNDSTYLDIKGGYKIGTKMVVFYYYGFENLKNVIFEDKLNKKLVENNDFFKTYKGEMHEWSYYPFSEWCYKLVNGNSLILLYKEKGRNEKK